ncbi:MAG: hypothetical protein ACKVOR_02930, partial [Flavobacteriales bacterium]
MKITRENYEAFFLDYLEGNLADHLVSEFHDFIKANPDLADELDDVDAAAGYAFNSEVFDGKQQLKKPELPITEDELDLLLAREAEGEVSDEELQVIEKLATQFTSVALSRKAFAQSFFTPEKINFEYKSTLYYNEQADMQSLPMRMAA